MTARSTSLVQHRVLVMLLVCAVLTRVGCVALLDQNFESGDASSYRASAFALVDHHTYSRAAPWEPTAYRPPLYPMFLAGIALVSRSVAALQTVQILLSVATLILFYRVAQKLSGPSALVAVALAALNPFEAVYSSAALSELLCTSLLVACLASLTLLSGWRSLLATGICAGLLCLCRDIYLALVPFAAFAWWVWGDSGTARTRLRQAVVVGAITALTIAPWTIRNAVHFSKLIPISAGRLGYSLWLGGWATNGEFTKSDVTGRVYPDEAFRTAEERELVAGAEKDLTSGDATFHRLFRERFEQSPLSVLRVWLVRWPLLWLGTRFDIFTLTPALFPRGSTPWTIVKVVLFAINAAIFAAALVGSSFAFRRRHALRWLTVPLLFTSLVYLPLNSFENRYSQPMFPFLTLLGGYGIVCLWELVRARRGSVAITTDGSRLPMVKETNG